jgi:hypothetical protein
VPHSVAIVNGNWNGGAESRGVTSATGEIAVQDRLADD